MPAIEPIISTIAFLAALMLIADGCRRAGLFEWLSERIARGQRGGPRRLLLTVFVTVSLCTAFLNLDATVLLMTPVVLITVISLGMDHRVYSISTIHLVNSASLLMPISNLTNLLVFHESGLSFGRFTLLMALPWLGAILVEWLLLPRVLPWKARASSSATAMPVPEDRAPQDVPVDTRTFVVLIATLCGFMLSGPLGIEPLWVAWAGALLILLPDLARGFVSPRTALRSVEPRLLVLILVLGMAADVLGNLGFDSVIASVMPSGDSLPALLGVAFIAAALTNLINNLPATVLLAPAVAGLGDGPLLAMLIGVGVGANLSYLGSVANLLWRKAMSDAGPVPPARTFTRVGLVTTPVALVVATTLLWLGLRIGL